MKPNDFGKKLLVDQCQRIGISDFVRKASLTIKESLLKNSLEIDSSQILLNISETGFGGTRYWFSCPNCNRRVGVLYKHPLSGQLGCRLCLGLDYRKHRYKGMIEDKLGRN